METSIRAVADKWFEAFNEHDLEKLLSLYDENAVHFSPKLKVRQPETGGYIKGKAALRAWWKDSFDRLPSLSYQPTSFIAEGGSIFMEYIRKVDGEPDMVVGEVLKEAGGKIVNSRVYHS